MTPGLLEIYQQLYQAGDYFYRIQNDSQLHLIIIPPPMISIVMNSECQKCEDNFCCIYLGQRTCWQNCFRQNWFDVHCQLASIEEDSPAVFCHHCGFLSERYAYKYIDRVANRNSYILQKHCRDHFTTKHCPHREETSVEMTRQPPIISCSHLFQNVNAEKTINIHQHSPVTSLNETGEAQVTSRPRDSSMGSRLSEMNRRSS